MNGNLAPGDPYRRPQQVDDETVEAVGKLSEALELVERARGRLYDFHQMIGGADLLAQEAADRLERAGHVSFAEAVRTELVGRNVLPGRWTFQIIDEFDDGYWEPLRETERHVRDALLEGRRHVYESEMKERRRTGGLPEHAPRPGGADPV